MQSTPGRFCAIHPARKRDTSQRSCSASETATGNRPPATGHQMFASDRAVNTRHLGQLERTFTLRASEGFVENFGARLLSLIAEEAPSVRFHFLHKLDKDSGPLRDGSVDLETGVVDKAIGPEVRAQALFRDCYLGVVRAGHPLSVGDITPARFAAARHVHVSRRDGDRGPIDDALAALGLQRQIATTVGGFSAALALVRASDLVACVHERHTGTLYAGMHRFKLPLPIAPFTVSMLWHPRWDGDRAHRWLRGCAREACAERVSA